MATGKKTTAKKKTTTTEQRKPAPKSGKYGKASKIGKSGKAAKAGKLESARKESGAEAAGKARKRKAPKAGKPPKASKPRAPARAKARERKPAAPPTVVRRTTPLGDYWHKLQACGWLEAVPTAEHRALRERIGAALKERPETVFQALAATSLDLECIEGNGPDELCSYHSVLRQLAEASHGKFQPEEILDELDPALGVARISFCLGDLSFHAEVPFRDDWVQPGLFEIVNRALETVGEPSRFHPLPADSQFAHLAFVPEAAFQRARDAGLIPAEPVSGRAP